jgi:glycosyltransferase involved in cell wall biosynthesis
MPRKVLLVVPYFPPHKGGMELFAANIAQQLSSQHGWDVVVLTTGDAGRLEITHRGSGLKIIRLPYWRKISNSPVSLSWFWRVSQVIRAERPDLINIHTPVPGLGDVASLMAGRCPVVVNYHMGTMRKEKSSLNSIIWVYEHVLLRPMLRKAEVIVGSSDYVKDVFLASYTRNVQTITPAVDSKLFRPAAVPVTDPRVIFVGSLNKSDGHKNLRSLLLACREMRAGALPGLRLTVVGDGDGRGMYEDLAASMNLADATTFTGWLERAELAEAYRSAAVFVLPSTNDSFPLVIAEAMASGLPVVSTQVGGIPTLVDNEADGLLVDPADVTALVKAVERILTDNTLARRMGDAGRDKAVNSLSWASRGRMTDELFCEILGWVSHVDDGTDRFAAYQPSGGIFPERFPTKFGPGKTG